MNELYELRDNSMHLPRYAWAGNAIGEGWDRESACDVCGDGPEESSTNLDVIITKGSKYPDILGCGAYPFLIVSARTLLVWQAHGIRGYDTYPVSIVEVKPQRLQTVVPPEYARIEPRGSCSVDVEASGFVSGSFCERHQRARVRQLVLSPAMQLVPGSWDGSDLFRDPVHFPRVIFCTRRLVDICLEAKLTNFRFDLLGKEIDHSGKGDLYSG
jgi:hypothetical protein